jgi:hypothetical protein
MFSLEGAWRRAKIINVEIIAVYLCDHEYGERVAAEFSIQIDRLFLEATEFVAEVTMPAD